MPLPHTTDIHPPQSWDEFEDMVRDLYALLWDDQNIQRNGRSGQAQQGVDIFGQPARLKGRFAGIQCKNYKGSTLTRQEIEQEAAKAEQFQPPLAEFIIATTESRDVNLQKAVRTINVARESAGKFPIHLIFWEELRNHLTDPAHYKVLQKYYPNVALTLKQPDDPIPLASQLRQESFKLGDDIAANFVYVQAPVQRGYDTAVHALVDASAGASGKRGILVQGEANAGKTRLALEALKSALPSWPVLCWSPANTVEQIPPVGSLSEQRLVIFIDDLQDYVPSGHESTIFAQVADMQALTLRTLLETLRRGLQHVVVVATCRLEDRARTQAVLGTLFTELVGIDIPTFKADPRDRQASAVIAEFRRLGALHLTDWDGTIGSLVLGLSAKQDLYLDLVRRHSSAATVLQAMKLLTLAQIPEHTERRLKATCAGVFGVLSLQEERNTWRKATEQLITLQFVTEERVGSRNELALVIRKDTYFSNKVIGDYPSPGRPHQLLADLNLLKSVLEELEDAPGLANLGIALYLQKQYSEALLAFESSLSLDPANAVTWANKGAALAQLERNHEALTALENALHLNPTEANAWSNKGAVLSKLGHPAEGLPALEQALTLDQTSAWAWANKGGILGILGRPEEALQAFEQALTLDPADAVVWRNKALALANLRRDQEALDAYEQAQENGLSDNAILLAGKGAVLNRLERNQEALPALEQALVLNPKDATSWRNKGITLSKLGQQQEALVAAEQALNLEPDVALSWYIKGTILGKLGRDEEALEFFERALELDPEVASAWANKGAALMRLDRYGEEALTALERALELEGQNLSTWYHKGLLLVKLGRDEAALDAFERVLELEPGNLSALDNKGAALARLARYEEALAALEYLLERDAENAPAWANRGAVFAEMNRSEEALQAFEQALTLNPEDIGTWRNKFLVLTQLGRHVEALEASNSVLKLDPANKDALFDKGSALLLLRLPVEALQALEQLLIFQPENAVVWSYKGVALAQLGSIQEALMAFEQAIRIDPTNVMAWSNKGSLLGELGHNDEALETFEQALRLEPENATIWRFKSLVLTNLGHHEEAMMAMERMRSIEPS